MINISKIVNLNKYNLIKALSNVRIYTILIFLFFIIYEPISNVRLLANILDHNVTPWVFPFLTNSSYYQYIFMLGLIFILCDAPFVSHDQNNIIIRTGRTNWILGQILYIISITFIYFLLILILSTLLLIPYLFLSIDWGKIFYTLSLSDEAIINGHLSVPRTMIYNYTPIKATLMSFFISWNCGILLGLVTLLGNIIFKNYIGVLVAIIIGVGDSFIKYYLNPLNGLPVYFSPISMSRLDILDPFNTTSYPTFLYVFCFYSITIILLISISVLYVKKRNSVFNFKKL